MSLSSALAALLVLPDPHYHPRWSNLLHLLPLLLLLLPPYLSADEDDEAADRELTILESAKGTVHSHQMHLLLDEESRVSGWVRMEQCHREMAPTGASAILFRRNKIRDLTILRTRSIGNAWISPDGTAVEMEDIRAGNEICIRGSMRTLHPDGDRYRLESGPFYLRFMDGYFPLSLQLTVDSRDAALHPVTLLPKGIPNRMGEYTTEIEVLFEGKLRITIFLAPVASV